MESRVRLCRDLRDFFFVSLIFTYALGMDCSPAPRFPLQSLQNARDESWHCAVWAVYWFSPLARHTSWQLPGEKLNEPVLGTNCISLLCVWRIQGNRDWTFVNVLLSLNRNTQKILFITYSKRKFQFNYYYHLYLLGELGMECGVLSILGKHSAELLPSMPAPPPSPPLTSYFKTRPHQVAQVSLDLIL